MNELNCVATYDPFPTDDGTFLEAKIKWDERSDINRHEHFDFVVLLSIN